ncbi:MAG: tRNA (pseudouridine(54)-N(1))-methyltransferase TrmY [Candidatus Pacearchaeota archaeon]
MREIVYFSRTAWTTGNFKDLMKAGRMDIACHAIIMSFFISNARRQDVVLHLFFYGPPDPPKHLEIRSKAPISKKDVAKIIKIMLYKYKEGKRIEALQDCFIEKKSLITFLEEKAAEGKKIYLLDEKGQDIRETKIEKDSIFVLGDHKGLPKKEKKRIAKIGKKISLGDITYFTSQAIAILQNELDRRGL